MKDNCLRYYFIILIFAFCILNFTGCATVPEHREFPSYSLNGEDYFPVTAFCTSKNIDWKYDTFTGGLNLKGFSHEINLLVGDNLVLVDGRPLRMAHPVDLYQGQIVAPYKLKEQVLDSLFRQASITPRRTVNLSSKIRKVIVDAGHGGNDPGAIGRSGLQEKDVNLDIARRLANFLRSEGVDVIMTRSSDRFIPLPRRVEIANDSQADLFVSIHSNANRVRSLKGFEVYYITPAVSDAKRALAAAKSEPLNLDTAYFASRSLDLKATVWDLVYTSSRAESISLARFICRGMDDICVIGIKGANYHVLRGAHMPAVLVEVGFLSNPVEERMLRNGFFREKLAQGILRGIEEYVQEAPIREAANR